VTQRAILQPCSGKAARKHFEETIQLSVPLSSIQTFLSELEQETLQSVAESGATLFWGVTPGELQQHLKKWKRIAPGDVVFFAQDGGLFSWAVVTSVLRNEALAEHLWGTTFSKNGKKMTWELMFSMTPLTEFSLSYSDLNRLVGRKPAAVVQEFNVLTEAASENLLQAIGVSDNPYIEPMAVAAYEESVLTPEFEELERLVISRQRNEQVYLRRILFGKKKSEACDLCGRVFSVGFLTAAHIKRRANCTDDEKRDVRNVAMSNCRFGCDELYGSGYVAVTDSGEITVSRHLDRGSAAFDYYESYLQKRKPRRWAENADCRPYFEAHRKSEFRQ